MKPTNSSTRSKQLDAASSDLSGQATRAAASPPVGVLPLGFRGVHVASLAALLVLFCALVPTGMLGHHKIAMISEYGYEMNDAGEIPWLRLRSFVNDAGPVHLKGLTNLQTFWLVDTQITYAELVRLKGLTKLEYLELGATQFTDARPVHLRGLTKLQDLWLNNTLVSDAAIAELQEALPTCQIEPYTVAVLPNRRSNVMKRLLAGLLLIGMARTT